VPLLDRDRWANAVPRKPIMRALNYIGRETPSVLCNQIFTRIFGQPRLNEQIEAVCLGLVLCPIHERLKDPLIRDLLPRA
jgi:hypothetical protein